MAKIFMDELNDFVSDITDHIQTSLKEKFDYALSENDIDKLYVVIVSELERVFGWPDYRSYL